VDILTLKEEPIWCIGAYNRSVGQPGAQHYSTPKIMRNPIVWALPALMVSASSSVSLEAQNPAPATKSGWQRPSDDQLRKRLSELQFEVTRHEATETPFHNEYWDNHEAGIYVDIISGEPLFSSLDKYDSGTGWPSFTKPLEPSNVKTKTDYKLLYPRTEVRSKNADSHLGHLFDDGPRPTGLRYCMNSAAMRFIPVSRLQAEGYGKYLPLFTKKR
jgi:methionine-R-sulfoxide reductase